MSGQKELLNLFDDLSDIILTDKTLVTSKDEDDENENEDDYENEDEDDETIKQNKIKVLNDYLDEIIDKSKSFEDQIESLKKVENLEEYYFINYFDDKDLKFKIFKLKLAHLSNQIDEDLFKQIFDHKFETLADKLINTTNKEENQVIINNVNKNKDKIFKIDEFND